MLIGFKAGIGVVIVLDQIPKLLGIHFAKGTFVHNLLAIVQAIPDTSLPTLAVGIVMIVLLVGLERFFPRAPAPLIVVAVGNRRRAPVRLAGLWRRDGRRDSPGPAVLHAAGLLARRAAWPGALGIALMSFTETIAAGRAFATSDEPPLRPNRELLATGLANAGGAFLGAMPSGGGTTQTAVNRLAGARTQMAELVTAAAALLTMLCLAPLIGLMPQATLAAVVIVYSIGLIKPADFRPSSRSGARSSSGRLAAVAGVVLLGTLQGILVAIVVSLVALAYQMADPPVHVLGRKPGTNVFRPRSKEHPEDETFPGSADPAAGGARLFRQRRADRREDEGARRRGEAEGRGARPQRRARSRVHGAQDADRSREKRQRERGVSLWLVGLNPEVLAMVQRSSLGKSPGARADAL